MLKGARGDQAIFNWHWGRVLFEACEQFGPAMRRLRIEIQNDQCADSICKPLLEETALAALRKEQNSIFDFPQDDWSDSEISFVVAQPVKDARIWGRARELAEDVCVDNELHSESVLSESIAWK